MRCCRSGLLVFVPIADALVSVIAVFTAYFVGVGLDTINEWPYVPFISDVGDLKPQSSVFTMGLTLSSFPTLATVVVRYLQIKNLYSGCRRLNIVALFLGLTIVLGKIVVSAFQLSSQIAVHFVGASMFFVAAVLYCFAQTFISWHIQSCRSIVLLRLICSIGMLASGGLFAIFLFPSLRIYNDWSYNVSQISEWFYVLAKIVYTSSFAYDFRGLRATVFVTDRSSDDASHEDLGNADSTSYLLIEGSNTRISS